jgi:hypothetical protein
LRTILDRDFPSLEEAAYAYGAAAWWFGRGCRWLNLPEVHCWEEAEYLVMREDRWRDEQAKQRLAVSEANERGILKWWLQHP